MSKSFILPAHTVHLLPTQLQKVMTHTIIILSRRRADELVSSRLQCGRGYKVDTMTSRITCLAPLTNSVW